MKKGYTIKQYQDISEALLKKHYGLELNDTRLCEEAYVKTLVDSQSEPFEYINEIAEDFGLDRLDDSSSCTISKADQDAAIKAIKRALESDSPSP